MMWNLIRWELRHLFSQKSIYLLLGLFVFFIIISSNFIDTSQKIVADKYKGTITEQELVEAQEFSSKITDPWSLTNEEAYLYYTYEELQIGANLQRIQEEIIAEKKVEYEATSNSSRLEKEINLRSDVNTLYYSYYHIPLQVVDFMSTLGFVIIGGLLLVGIFGMVSRDDSTLVSQYTLTSRFGRTRLMTAKLFVVTIYTIVCTCVITIMNWIFQYSRSNYWQHGLDGWEVPIHYFFKFMYSPYPITFMQYHLIQLGILFISSLALAVLFLFVSTVTKKPIVSLIIGGAIFTMPLFIVSFFSLHDRYEWVNQAYTFTLPYMMKVDSLFMEFRALSIGELHIVLPILVIYLALLLIILFSFATHWYMQKVKVI